MITTISFISFSRIFSALLLLGVFISHTGELTRFLHRLSFFYFLLYMWFDISGVVFRFENIDSITLLEVSQEDSILFRLFSVYATATVAIFFFGVAERFFLSKRGVREFSLLVLFLHVGGLFALRLNTLRDLLLALERVTLSSYVLITFERQNRFSTYAGIQYFLLGSLPSAMLILSFGVFYLQGGSLALQDLDLLFGSFASTSNFFTSFVVEQSSLVTSFLYNVQDQNNSGCFGEVLFNTDKVSSLFSFNEVDALFSSVHPFTSLSFRALFFFLFNLLFKLTAAPFHVWAPSVYGKAPISSVTFLSIYSKARVLFFLFKLLNTFLHTFSYIVFDFFRFCSVLSIFIGRIGAFTEKTIKRFFVFSSMGHVGFMLVGLSLFTLEGAGATFHYLAVYIISSFVRWFFLLTIGRQNTHLTQISFVKTMDPVLALLFAFLVFSMSGIPPFGGFFIKLDILSALLESSHFFRNYILFFFTVASFFYYLRVIKILFFDTTSTARQSNILSTQAYYFNEHSRFEGRIWLRVFILQFLAFYLFIVQKPLLRLQSEVLASFFLYLHFL